MRLVQVTLQHANQVQTAWIEKRPNVKKGCFVTLKGAKQTLWWKVIEMYGECDSTALHSDWEVGGLNKRQH